MPNTAKKHGKQDIKTLIEAAHLFNILNIQDDKTHKKAVELAGFLMDEIDDDPKHPLNTFFDLLADAIERYEDKI